MVSLHDLFVSCVELSSKKKFKYCQNLFDKLYSSDNLCENHSEELANFINSTVSLFFFFFHPRAFCYYCLLLLDSPVKLLRAGKFNKSNVIVGVTKEDGSIYVTGVKGWH